MHECKLTREESELPELTPMNSQEESAEVIRNRLFRYLDRLSMLVDNDMNCVTVLNWLTIKNQGERLYTMHHEGFNKPVIAHAVCIEDYKQAYVDEISIERGALVAITEMVDNIVDENGVKWWKGKQGYEVGYFPAHCVAIDFDFKTMCSKGEDFDDDEDVVATLRRCATLRGKERKALSRTCTM